VSKEFSGRVVLVTGGARGLGSQISGAFALKGAHVIVNYFHAREEAPRLLDELLEISSAELLRASVADRGQVDAMFDAIEQRHGGLDILVNNAAAGALLPLDDLDESHWQRALDTNLRGSLRCSRRAAVLMAGRPDASIVNLSSVGSSLVISDYATVGTSKAAVEALTRYLAVEFAPDGIRVNTASGGLLDGSVATMFPHAHELADQVRRATPLGHRLGTEHELAQLVVFLASPSASWITGQTVIADGGLSLGSVMLSPQPSAAAPRPPVQISARAAPPADDRIAVVGMGVVTPGANTAEELWTTLQGEHHVFTEPALFDIDSFHSTDPGTEDRTYTRRSGFITDFTPHPRLRSELRDGTVPSRESTTLWLRHSLYSALDGVGTRDGDSFFAAFGYTADGSQELEERLVLAGYLARLGNETGRIADELRARYDRLGGSASEYLPHRVGRNTITGLLPEDTELVMVDTACSSALYGVDLGIKALRDGADVAVCGGAFAYSARNLVLFSKLHGLSRSGEVRSFDSDANGVLFSDGAGVVVLKRLSRARADGDAVLGIVDGVGLSCDGKGKAVYAPNADGQAIALHRAYGKGGVDPATVDWVVAHATGTQAGDSTEMASLHEVAAAGPPALLSSNKPIIGHTGWTAGLVSLVHALLGLRHGTVPAQRYLREPISALEGSRFTPPTEHTALPTARPRRVAVSSFGFGGTNAHLLLTDDQAGAGSADHHVSAEDIVVVGWAVDLPGAGSSEDIEGWLRGESPAPAASFGEHYPIPEFGEVRLPPATLRNMDRSQIMLLRAASRLDEPVRAACADLHDTTGIVVGHMGPTRRAVHYALRCYLGDLHRCTGARADGDDRLTAEVQALTESVRALVPPSTEDAFPGIMPNIIPARLAAQADFHGLNLTVDTGPDSGLDALRTAERYLRHGDLDVALVAGINGNSTLELAEVLSGDGDTRVLAEGAFLTVLTRASVAAERGLPVLARIRTDFSDSDAAATPEHQAPLAGSGRTYLGADPIVALLASLSGPHASGRIASVASSGPQLHVVKERPAPPVERTEYHLAITERRIVRPALPAIPEGALLIVADTALLTGVEVPASANVVVMPTRAEDGTLPDPDALVAVLPDPSQDVTHVRVLADLAAAGTGPEDLSMVERLRVLHDLAYLAAARWMDSPGSSFVVLLVDAVRSGVPHPASGLFTGLVKSLAREQPAAVSFAVVTDVTTMPAAFDIVADESRCHHELGVAVHDGGRRREYIVAPAPAAGTGALPISRDSVVVAAGGGRGLTAEILTALAEQATPTIYLLSRQGPGASAEPGTKTAFLAEGKRARPERTVAELSADYDRLSAAAAVRRTMDRLTGHCGPGRVHHLVCDLTDPAAVQTTVNRIHHGHGRVDLLINAAGLHHGGTVRATPLSVARQVRDTKLLAYLNLRSAFAGQPPRIWHNFGSLLAVLGWPGEVDYCSGNDLLNAAAGWHHQWGGTVEKTLAWALWDEAGFAAEPLTRDLLRRRGNLTGVSIADGQALYLSELTAPSTPVVTFLGEAEQRVLDRGRTTPWLSPRADSADLAWIPDPARDGYLTHHLLKGVPTLPAALIIELAAQAAGADGRWPVTVKEARFHFPVATVPGRARTYHLRRVDTEPGGNTTAIHLLSDLAAPDGSIFRRDLLNAEATVTVPAVLPALPPDPLPARRGEQLVPEFYSPGGLVDLSGPFASLEQVQAGDGRITARFAPHLGIWAGTFATLTTPALLVDALLQLALLAAHRDNPVTDAPPMPVGIERIDLYTGLNDTDLLDRHGEGIALSADPVSGVATAQAPDGAVLLRVRGVQASKAAPAARLPAEMEKQ